MWQKIHRLVVAMATKTVKNQQSSTGTKKKSFFATAETAKQQLTKKTEYNKQSCQYNFNTTNSRARKLQKLSEKIQRFKIRIKNRLTEGDVRKIQLILRLVVGYPTRLDKRRKGGGHPRPEKESISN